MARSKIYTYTKDELQYLFDTSASISEVLKKINIKGGSSFNTIKRIITEYSISLDKMEENKMELIKNASKNNKAKPIDEYLKKDGIKINGAKLREKLIKSELKERKCELCGLSEWLNAPIKLELHHKDGDHYNNELDNLELLCPNCHATTDNYGVYNSEKYKKTKEKHYCNNCKKELGPKNKTGLCHDCYVKFRPQNTKVNQKRFVQHAK